MAVRRAEMSLPQIRSDRHRAWRGETKQIHKLLRGDKPR